MAKAGIEPSVGSVCDGYENVLDETINGLYKTEVICRRISWRTIDEVEKKTLKCIDWFYNRHLLERIGNIPLAEAEKAFYANLNTLDMVASYGLFGLRQTRDDSIDRLTIMVMASGLGMGFEEVKRYCATSINFIVQLSRQGE